jgi:hypothetical protein
MDENLDPIEDLWNGLLSRQPELVRAAFSSLDLAERTAVLAHLQRIVNEAGWHPEQRLSAQAALDALEGFEGVG